MVTPMHFFWLPKHIPEVPFASSAHVPKQAEDSLLLSPHMLMGAINHSPPHRYWHAAGVTPQAAHTALLAPCSKDILDVEETLVCILLLCSTKVH